MREEQKEELELEMLKKVAVQNPAAKLGVQRGGVHAIERSSATF